jgi:hypothetical protein
MDDKENTLLHRCKHGNLKTKITLTVSGNKGQIIEVKTDL